MNYVPSGLRFCKQCIHACSQQMRTSGTDRMLNMERLRDAGLKIAVYLQKCPKNQQLSVIGCIFKAPTLISQVLFSLTLGSHWVKTVLKVICMWHMLYLQPWWPSCPFKTTRTFISFRAIHSLLSPGPWLSIQTLKETSVLDCEHTKNSNHPHIGSRTPHSFIPVILAVQEVLGSQQALGDPVR